MSERPRPRGWLNRTVLGIGATSFLSDVAHEAATVVLPLVAAGLGSPSLVLGTVEGVADAASGVAKLWSGWWSDRLKRRKPLAVAGYVMTALFTASLAVCFRAWQAVAARSLAWIGRGIRSPARSALLADDTDPAHYGKAFGFERAMDTAGAVAGPLLAAGLMTYLSPRALLSWTLVPGLMAAAAMAFLVREKPREPAPPVPFAGAFGALPRAYRPYLLAVGLFGMGDFAHTLLILRAIEILSPILGPAPAAAAAMTLYALHNVAGAVSAFVFGILGDRYGHRRTLALAYLFGPLMVVLLILAPTGGGRAVILLAASFLAGGALLAAEDALESAAAAELLPGAQRGTGFGLLAAVNSAGDLVSSLGVGILWTALGPGGAFAAALLPMLAGAVLMGVPAFSSPGRPGTRGAGPS